jgi:hypothetical protein
MFTAGHRRGCGRRIDCRERALLHRRRLHRRLLGALLGYRRRLRSRSDRRSQWRTGHRTNSGPGPGATTCVPMAHWPPDHRGATGSPRSGGGGAAPNWRARGAWRPPAVAGRPWGLPRRGNWAAPVGERRSAAEAARKREEGALKFPSRQRLGLGLPLRLPLVQVAGLRMATPPNFLAGRRRMGSLSAQFFALNLQTGGYFAGRGGIGGLLELL